MRLHLWSETNGGAVYFTLNALRLYYLKDASSYTSHGLNPIASYNKNQKECKFTITGRDEIVTITCPNPQAGSFFLKDIITANTSNSAAAGYCFAFKKLGDVDDAEKGIYIEFPDTLPVDKIQFFAGNNSYGCMDAFLQIDNFKTPIQKVDNGTGTVANNFTLSAKAITYNIPINTKVKGIRGKDGKLYFLKPKDKANG